MANKIKGLTIEIAGETQLLTKSLGEVNKHSRDLKSELRDVERLLKLNPSDTTLLAQKQKILAESVSNTKSKLETLKEAERQAQEQFKKGEISEEQYRALQREVIKTEQGLKKLESKTKSFAETSKKSLKEVGKSFKDVGGKIEGAGKKFAPVSGIAAGAIAGVGAMAVKAGQAADDINTLAKKTGLSTEEIQKFQYASERIDVPLETLTGSMAKLTKNMESARQGSKNQVEAFKELGVSFKDDVTGQLRDKQDVFDDLVKALSEMENETQRDALAMQLFGKSAQDLNPLILGGSDALKELGQEAEEAGLILSQDALNSANEFNDSIDKLKDTASGSFAAIGTEIATALVPIMEDLGETIGKVLDWVRGLDEGTVKMILTILAVVAGIAPLIIITGKVISAVGTIISILPTLGAAFTALTGPIGIVIAIIAGLIAAGVALYKNWDTIKEKCAELQENLIVIWNSIKEFIAETINAIKDTVITVWDSIKSVTETIFNAIKQFLTTIWAAYKTLVTLEINAIKKVVTTVWNAIKTVTTTVFNAVKNAILNPVNAAKDGVKKAVDAIFGFFANLKIPQIKIPKIKLPHFSIKGSFSLNPPSIPKFGVDWYKTGAIFNSPSVIGVGEAGAEAVLPIEKIDGIIAAALNKAGGKSQAINLNIGTLIADDYGLKQLERKLRSFRIDENARLGEA